VAFKEVEKSFDNECVCARISKWRTNEKR